MQANPKPAPQPSRRARLAPDLRPLPLPEPYDKHDPHPSRNQRHQDAWTWDAWRDWLFNAASQKWHKPSIRRVLKLRDQDPANRSMDFTKTADLWTKQGWIYGLFHFATGRWYVGQTIREYWVRAQQHWHSRKRLTDVLHNALANEISPFAFVVFPLEKVAEELYQCRTRDATQRRFRLFATERERYWVGRLNSLWPQGFNSAFPGKPVSAWVQRSWRCPAPDRMELNEEEINEVGRQVSSWLKRLHSEGSAALREMRNWDKAKLRESLDWIQAHVPQRERRANLISVETALIEQLRDRKANPRARHYLKFLYGNQEACHLMLRNVLRDPEVYSKHPEPEVAAAIMVCDKFRPQLQAMLCNYAKVAQELDLEKALHDSLQDCRCGRTLWKPDPSCQNGEGHVVMADTRNLKWPYLRTMVHRGSKFGLTATWIRSSRICVNPWKATPRGVLGAVLNGWPNSKIGPMPSTKAAGRIGPDGWAPTPPAAQPLKATPA